MISRSSQLPALPRRSISPRRNISSQAIFAANLAIEEIVSNVLKYGYHDASEHEITIGLTLAENTLEIEISDDGRAFDPFNQPVAHASHAAHRIGGLGIHLIRNMLDRCEYKRHNGRNIIRLTKGL